MFEIIFCIDMMSLAVKSADVSWTAEFFILLAHIMEQSPVCCA